MSGSKEPLGTMVTLPPLLILGPGRNDDAKSYVSMASAKKDTKTTVMFYVANEGTKGSIELANEPDMKGLTGTVVLAGSLPVLGDFKLEVTRGPQTNQAPVMGNAKAWAERPLSRTMYASMQLLPNLAWKVKGIACLKFWCRKDRH